jgi:hypothetical protein
VAVSFIGGGNRRKPLVGSIFGGSCIIFAQLIQIKLIILILLKYAVVAFNNIKTGGSRDQYFSYIVAVSFIGGGKRRKPLTCRKSLTNFIT